MADPTRPLPNLVPQPDGSWTGRTVLTPTALKTRGLFTMPPSKVVPVIVVPGIMGTNLRAARDPKKAGNGALKRGEAAWRPPNSSAEGAMAVYTWMNRDPITRQKILDGATLEVDDGGDINLPLEARNYGTTEGEVRKRHWGEIHWDSYGGLLYALEVRLNHTFEMDPLDNVRVVCRHWKKVMNCDAAGWGVRHIEKITERELEKHAEYYYPVYACGYNWLESCEISAKRLRERIEETILYWNKRKLECKQVILVTHSMGGLVARACAKQVPERILGVIHGVMPALGAPACYRRIACGTESWSPSNDGILADLETSAVSYILGDRPELTMPVMATAAGPLQLLPNHLYPSPWLHVTLLNRVNNKDVPRDVVHLPTANPYDLYRDTQSWYRLIDPGLVDPARKYKGEPAIREAIRKAINSAEYFHKEVLGTFYHPNTYAFYGADPAHMSFGAMRWVARDPGQGAVFTEGNLRSAAFAGFRETVGRRVKVEGKTTLEFVPARQDSAGDGTVPHQSGAGPRGKVKQLFEIRGLDHQGTFKNETTVLLTQHLIAKLSQELA